MHLLSPSPSEGWKTWLAGRGYSGQAITTSSRLVPFSRDSRTYALMGLAMEERCLFKFCSQQLCPLWQKNHTPVGKQPKHIWEHSSERDTDRHLVLIASQKEAGTKDFFFLEISTVPHIVYYLAAW